MSAALRRATLAMLVLLPSVAVACPACLGSQRNNGILRLIGLFMLIPFGVFAVVLRAVRQAARESRSAPPPSLLDAP